MTTSPLPPFALELGLYRVGLWTPITTITFGHARTQYPESATPTKIHTCNLLGRAQNHVGQTQFQPVTSPTPIYRVRDQNCLKIKVLHKIPHQNPTQSIQTPSEKSFHRPSKSFFVLFFFFIIMNGNHQNQLIDPKSKVKIKRIEGLTSQEHLSDLKSPLLPPRSSAPLRKPT